MSQTETRQTMASARSGATVKRESKMPLLLVTIGIVVVMQIASYFVPPYVLPSPVTIFHALKDILTTQYSHIGVTALRLLAAIAFAMATGILLGVIMGVFSRVRPYLHSIIIIDTGIPALSWMLLAIFWFSNPEVRIFFILSVILIPFYALNVYDAIRALPRDLVDMIESFRPRRLQVLRYLILPHIVPYILTTTKAVIGYAVRMAIFAELVASAIGIGSRMSLAQSMFKIDQVLGWTVLLVIANLGLQALLTKVEAVLLKWRPEAEVR